MGARLWTGVLDMGTDWLLLPDKKWINTADYLAVENFLKELVVVNDAAMSNGTIIEPQTLIF